jgi:hypothetical protein
LLHPAECLEFVQQVKSSLYIPAHQIILQAIEELARAGHALNFESLKSHLRSTGQLAEAGDTQYLDELFSKGAYSALLFPRYAADVEDCAKRRVLCALSKKASDFAEDIATPLPQTLAVIESDLFELAGGVERMGPGKSLVDYSKATISAEDVLLGNRFLCREGGLLVVAPSGQGKSTISIQMAALWSCGLAAFGIEPAKPLRILIVQAEDDEGDCIEICQMVKKLELTPEQRDLVNKNTQLIQCSLIGKELFDSMSWRLVQRPVDLVILNPLSAFTGCDVRDTAKMSQFLRRDLAPILKRHRCGLVVIHHTAKTNFQNTEKYQPADWQYWGAGAAEITNWARAILVIKPVTERIFRFIAAKRGIRIGWSGFERYFCHSRELGVIRWDEPSEAEIAKARAATSKRKLVDLEAVLELVPLVDPEPKRLLENKIGEKLDLGQRKAQDALKLLAEQGLIIQKPVPNPNGARPFEGWVRTGQSAAHSPFPL